MNQLLAIAAIVEAATGLALIASPPIVTRLLLGADVSGLANALGRMGGFGLLSLGLACWPGRYATNLVPALRAMVIYNALITLFLVYLGIGGEWVGHLLWPAVALHAVLTVLLARTWIKSWQLKKSKGQRPESLNQRHRATGPGA
jgi:hypothetical protein